MSSQSTDPNDFPSNIVKNAIDSIMAAGENTAKIIADAKNRELTQIQTEESVVNEQNKGANTPTGSAGGPP